MLKHLSKIEAKRLSKWETIDRRTLNGFVRYMTNNKFYYESVFGKEATLKNIKESYYEVINNRWFSLSMFL